MLQWSNVGIPSYTNYLECGGTAPIFIHISPELPLNISEMVSKEKYFDYSSETNTQVMGSSTMAKPVFLAPHPYHIDQILKAP